jgi:hypothetical protein
MASVTGFTAERMKQIEDETVVDGDVVGDDLILTTRAGAPINAGNVRGPQGTPGVQGPQGIQGSNGVGAIVTPPGRWLPTWQWSDSSTFAMESQNLRMTRCNTPQFDALSVEVTGAVGGSTIVLFVYNCDAVGNPTTLRASGTIAGTTTGVKTVAFTPLIPAGTYWIGVITTGVTPGPAMKTAGTTSMNGLCFSAAATVPAANIQAWSLSGFVSVPPNPFVGTVSNVQGFPQIYCRGV